MASYDVASTVHQSNDVASTTICPYAVEVGDYPAATADATSALQGDHGGAYACGGGLSTSELNLSRLRHSNPPTQIGWGGQTGMARSAVRSRFLSLRHTKITLTNTENLSVA